MTLIIRNTILFLGTLLMTFQGMASKKGAEIHFNSSCDFKELTMNIIEEQNVNPDSITLNITLQPAASARLIQASRNHLNQKMSMYINGVKISAATIHAVLNMDRFQVAVDKQLAEKVIPGLLGSQCHKG